MAEILEFVLEIPHGRKLDSAVPAGRGIVRDRRIAHRTRDRGHGSLRFEEFHLVRSQAALSRAIRFPEASVQFRLQDPKPRVRRIEFGEPIEGLQRRPRIVEGRLGRGHREQGVRVLRVHLEPFAGDLHDEGEPPRALLLGFEDRAFGRDDGGGRRGLGRLADDPHPGFRHLEDPERRVRRGVLEVKDADLPEDPIARPDALHLDDAVEGLEERRDLGPGVHVLLQEDDAREPVAVELLLRALCERIDLGDLVRVHRGREHFDDGTAGRVRREGGDCATQGHAEVREIDRGADHDAFLLDVEDRFFAPGVPVHDPQAILGRDRVQVHAESTKVRDDRVGRLARDDHESASARLEAFRQEGEGEAELLLARRALEDDARSDGQAALDHGVETLNARGQPRHAITIPKVG